MNLDDPNLTAYALGELPEQQRNAIEDDIARSPEAQAFVGQTQETAQLLRGEFRNELQEAAKKPLNIMPLPMPRTFWSDARWLSIGTAALLAIAAVITVVVFSNGTLNPDLRLAGRTNLPSKNDGKLQMEVEAFSETSDNPAGDLGMSDESGENGFVSASANPVSRISFNVAGSSYEDIRHDIERGAKPTREAVRLEQLVNHFTYDYPAPLPNETFAITLAIGACPWQAQHRLVRVAVRAREARGVELTARFNPAAAESYRLLGYENRGVPKMEAPDDSVREGQTLTVLYEIVPNESKLDPSLPLLSASVSYDSARPGQKSIVQATQIEDYGDDFSQAPDDFKFAAAVAEFGMILRDSPHKGNGSLASVLEWSNESKGHDGAGHRAGFIELVRTAQAL